MLNHNAVSTEIIARVCIKVHEQLMDDIAGLARHASAHCEETTHSYFHYDWRKSNLDNARRLAGHLDSLGATSIVLVTHSNGGNVGRLVLESGDYPSVASRIHGYVGIGNPSFGSSLAIAGALGAESSELFKPEQVRRLSAERRFSSVYQNFPHPGRDKLFQNGQAINLYDAAVMTRPPFNLEPSNLHDATEHQSKLNFGARPPSCAYTLIAGKGHPTVDVVEYRPGGSPEYRLTMGEGDGTVPFWSAAPTIAGVATVPIPGDHLFAHFTDQRFRNALSDAILHALQCDVPTMLAPVAPATISLNKRVYGVGEEMHVLVMAEGIERLAGARLVIHELVEEDEGEAWSLGDVVADNTLTESVLSEEFAEVRMSAPMCPNAYEMSLLDANGMDLSGERAGAAGFVVVKRGS